MAKRTPGLEKVVSIIPKAIHELGPKQEREFYQHWVLWHWEDIVGKAYAQNVKAVRIEREVLYVCCRNPAWSNETRYQMPRIIQKVNNYAGGEMIKDIRFSRSWSIADWDAHDAAADTVAKASEAPSVPEVNVGRERAKMPLDAADIKAAETVSEGLEDEDLACKLRQLYRNGRQLDKLRRARGWKPCPTCGHLCPPQAASCSSCRRKQEEDVRARIRAVLRDIPWARCKEVCEYVPECTPQLLNEQRAALVQLMAAKVAVNDRTSMEAKTLVMLYRCLPPDKLTEDAIRRALYELRFNMYWPPDYKMPKRYEAIPLRHAQKRQYGKRAAQAKSQQAGAEKAENAEKG